jgi:hypothetical protein
MIALQEIDRVLLENRGAYSTVRAAHEDEMKAMQMLCGELSSISSRILKRATVDDDSEPTSVVDLLMEAKSLIDRMGYSASRIESLALQRAELKPLAWPKK